MKKNSMTAKEAALELVKFSPKVVDIDRVYSHGPGGANSFVNEAQKAIDVSWTLTNPSSGTTVVLAIGNLSESMYADLAEAKAALGFDYMIKDGVIATVESDKEIVGASNNAGRTIDQLLKYIGKNPTRVTRLSLESYGADNAADTSNYAQSLKTAWVSPFRKPVEDELDLRRFQSGGKFQPRFLEIDFTKEGFPVVWSNEHFFLIRLRPGTSLNLTMGIGMQDSAPQRMFRQVSQVDRTLAPLR